MSPVAHPPSRRRDPLQRRAVPESDFTFIDLFAGIGGFHRALAGDDKKGSNGLGGTCVLASEIDEHCQDVYERNFGLRPEGDIRALTEGPEVLVRDHHVLCAGFPCQPFSKSGYQRGIHETRGTLFYNILRVLAARKPRFVILENVRNLAGPRQRSTWQTIILSLRQLGYRVPDEPTIFSPHLLPRELGGAPQVRERVFILAEHVGQDSAWLSCDPLVSNSPVAGWDPKDWDVSEVLEPDSQIEGLDRYALRADEVAWIDAWDEFAKRLAKSSRLPGFPIWARALRPEAEYPAWTPAWKVNFLEKNAALFRENKRWIPKWIRYHGVDGFPESRQKFEWQAQDAEPDLWSLVMQMRPSGIRVKAPTYLPALVAINQTSIIGPRRRRITPREAARLQGLPDTHILHENDAVAYKQLGNAVNVGVVRHVARALFDASEVGWPGLERRTASAS